MSKRTELEDALAFQLRAAKLPKAEREFRFAPPRRWRFDFAWPAQMLAVEVEGGIFAAGRHNRPLGMIADMEKYNEAALLGWRDENHSRSVHRAVYVLRLRFQN